MRLRCRLAPVLGVVIALLIIIHHFDTSDAAPNDKQKKKKKSKKESNSSRERRDVSGPHRTKFGVSHFSEHDPRHWYEMAGAEIHYRQRTMRPLHRRAKNVIFFLGDGMGVSTITASRIFKGQLKGGRGEEGYLEFDRFPYSALIKTYNLDKQVADSAGTATAYLTGVKANFATLGVSGSVNTSTLDCDLIRRSAVTSILEWALDAGKAAGLVTTTRVTHATPAASYSHVASRKWESSVPAEAHGQQYQCKDIARQLIEDYPGNRLNVILGGGMREFTPGTSQTDLEEDETADSPRRSSEGKRKDSLNLVDRWFDRKAKQPKLSKSEYRFVTTSAELRAVDFNSVRYLFGLFAHSHMTYDQMRDKSPDGEPSLTEMTEAAIKLLTKQGGDKGFVLLVEGGRIDHAHHQGYPNLALYETVEFDRAIGKARTLVPADDTLVLVTADHSHGLTINGYQSRGNPINGYAGLDTDKIPYTSLMYSNGPGYKTEEERKQADVDEFHDLKFRPHAGIHSARTFHTGEDVAVFGVGPMAHLFGGSHEQSYIAHVVGFAACIGVYRNETHCASGRQRSPFNNDVTSQSTRRRGNGDALSVYLGNRLQPGTGNGDSAVTPEDPETDYANDEF